MPNEQTSVPLFTAGEVLTAANMNISAGTGVPVFTNTTTRDAAFGGAGEKVLAEGQLCYLSSTNVVQYYDGAAWATVGPATAGGLVFITGTTFSAASSVSLPTSTFTSTYANYRILLTITAGSVNAANLNFRLRAAGTDNSTSNYNVGGVARTFAGVTNTQESTNDTVGYMWGNGSTYGGYTSMDVFGPQLTQPTTINSQTTYEALAGFSGNMFKATTSFDSMSFFPASGTITGNYKVYGYTNS